MSSRRPRLARHRQLLVATGAFLAFGTLAATLPASAGEAAPARALAHTAAGPTGKVTWNSGVYSGPSVPENEAFANWRGRRLDAVTLFQGASSASEMSNVKFMASQYAGRSERIVLSSALWPQGSGGTLKRASVGAYDPIFRQLARNLVASGMPRVTLRLGWEFNGDWQPWRVLNRQDAKYFANAWRHIVTTMRAVPGEQFTFEWCPVAINGLLNPLYSWPGSRFVDFFGMSVYNYTPNALRTPPAKRFQQLRTWKYGLNWHVRAARYVRKPVTYPEWGAINRPFSPATSSGDDPYFIAAMFNHFKATQPAYEMYFDVDTFSNFTFYGIHTGSGVNPRSAAMYKRLWGRR